MPKGRFPPAHPPTHRQAPQARGRSPHHPPSVHAIPTACTSTTRHGGEGVLAHGRTGTRAQGREVTRWLSNNNKKHEPQRQAPSASCHLTPTHMRTHTHTHTVGKAKFSVLAEVGWTNHWELPYLPPRVEGGGGGGVVTSVVTTAKNSLTLYVPPSRI